MIKHCLSFFITFLSYKELLSELILATAQDYKAPDKWPLKELVNVMRDVDYAILYDKANYGWYSLGVYLEYFPIVGIEKYIANRSKFLKNVLCTEFAYQSPKLMKNMGSIKSNIHNEYGYWLNK